MFSINNAIMIRKIDIKLDNKLIENGTYETLKVDMVVHGCNPNKWTVEVRDGKFKFIFGYIRVWKPILHNILLQRFK